MVEKPSYEKQLENQKKHAEMLKASTFSSKMLVDKLLQDQEKAIFSIENIRIRRTLLLNFKAYAETYRIFHKISELRLSPENMLHTLGVNVAKFHEVKKRAESGEKINPEEALKLLNVKKEIANDDSRFSEKVMLELLDSSSIETTKKISDNMFFTLETFNQILRGVDTLLNIGNTILITSDEKTKRFMVEKFFPDSQELYLKVLREYYRKETGKTLDVTQNGILREHFKEKYPVLLTTSHSSLRNDITHLDHKISDGFTTQQLLDEAYDILEKVVISVYANNKAILEFFRNATKKLN